MELVCLTTEVVVFEAHLSGMVLTHWVTWDRVSAVSGPVSPAACKERILPSIAPSMSRGQSDAKRRWLFLTSTQVTVGHLSSLVLTLKLYCLTPPCDGQHTTQVQCLTSCLSLRGESLRHVLDYNAEGLGLRDLAAFCPTLGLSALETKGLPCIWSPSHSMAGLSQPIVRAKVAHSEGGKCRFFSLLLVWRRCVRVCVCI